MGGTKNPSKERLIIRNTFALLFPYCCVTRIWIHVLRAVVVQFSAHTGLCRRTTTNPRQVHGDQHFLYLCRIAFALEFIW